VLAASTSADAARNLLHKGKGGKGYTLVAAQHFIPQYQIVQPRPLVVASHPTVVAVQQKDDKEHIFDHLKSLFGKHHEKEEGQIQYVAAQPQYIQQPVIAPQPMIMHPQFIVSQPQHPIVAAHPNYVAAAPHPTVQYVPVPVPVPVPTPHPVPVSTSWHLLQHSHACKCDCCMHPAVIGVDTGKCTNLRCICACMLLDCY
jgi:hypothetical protein